MAITKRDIPAIMSSTLVFATHNAHKASEIRALLPTGTQLLTLDDANILEDIPETGTTLVENALLKARYIYNTYKLNCFADDTGLEVDALNAEPGVYSARYAGKPSNSENNISLLLHNMLDKENRKAHFKTVIALIIEGREHLFEGMVEGQILYARKGSGGFGYDPIFLPDGYDISFAEMSLDAKNAISHRGRALKQMMQFLQEGNK